MGVYYGWQIEVMFGFFLDDRLYLRKIKGSLETHMRGTLGFTI